MIRPDACGIAAVDEGAEIAQGSRQQRPRAGKHTMQSRSHRRSTKVCTRCRQRKTKCDFQFPACTSCKLANASCLGFDPVTRKPVPRSLVKSLEARVAELESAVLPFRAGPQNVPHSMASKVAQATISYGVPTSGSYLYSKISSSLFFRPSCPPLAVVRARGTDQTERRNLDLHEWPKQQAKRPLTSNLVNLKSVPASALTRMIRNYVDIHLPQYPCVSELMLENIVRRTQDGELEDSSSLLVKGSFATSGIGHFEYFVLFIVLAISAMTLTWTAEDQARAASESFFKSALRHLQVLEEHSEIRALQISLLLAHYAHMCPERVDNWTCIANAIKIVLNLGLHRERPEGLLVEQAKLRSELFWVSYGMERSLCSNLRLPLSFPEEVITNKLEVPSHNGTEPLDPSEIRKKSSANHIYQYRGLETEVHRVLHLEDDVHNFGCTTIENWIHDITRRLEAWYEVSQSYTPYNMLEFKHVQYYHLVARIHRPTPRLRTRTSDDRRIVLESSLRLIEDYLGQERRSRLFYPWHGVHILFEIVVISLEACWSSRIHEPLKKQVTQILETSIPQCLQLLSNIGKRWNEASVCADTLRPLVQKISSALGLGEHFPVYDDKLISEEIQSLLFSDGTLTWNNDLQADNYFGLEHETNFFDNMIVDDMELLQWAPEWDIMPAEIS